MISPYVIKIAPLARKQILATDARMQKKIVKFIKTLAVNPHLAGAKRIEGMTGLYRLSLNHLRFIYKVDEQEVLLLVVK